MDSFFKFGYFGCSEQKRMEVTYALCVIPPSGFFFVKDTELVNVLDVFIRWSS